MGDAVTWLLQMLATALGPYVGPVIVVGIVFFALFLVTAVNGIRANRTREKKIRGA